MVVVNRYSQPIGAAGFAPLSLQELSLAPSMLRQRQDIAEQQLSELGTNASNYQGSDPLINKTLSGYNTGINQAIEELNNSGYNRNTARNLLNLRKRYNQEVRPINQFIATKRDALNQLQKDKSRLGVNFLPSRDITGVTYEQYLNNPGSLSYTPINRQDIVKNSAAVFSNFKNQIRNNPQFKAILGGQYFERLTQKGFKNPAEVIDFVRNNSQGRAVVQQIYESMPALRGLDPNVVADAIIQGAYSGIGSQDVKTLANRGFGEGSGISGGRTGRGILGIAGTRQIRSLGPQGSKQFDTNIDNIIAEKAKNLGLKGVSNLIQLNDKIPIQSVPFVGSSLIAGDTKPTVTEDERKARQIKDEVDAIINRENAGTRKSITIGSYLIDPLRASNEKEARKIQALGKNLSSALSDDRMKFKGSSNANQEAYDSIKGDYKVLSFSYRPDVGLYFDVEGIDDNKDRVVAEVYLPRQNKATEQRYIDYLANFDPYFGKKAAKDNKKDDNKKDKTITENIVKTQVDANNFQDLRSIDTIDAVNIKDTAKPKASDDFTNWIGEKSRLSNLPRGIRNNNPGNIEKSRNDWKGKIKDSDHLDNRFEVFKTPEHGVRALSVLLSNYIKKGKATVPEIISKYAPSSENNTDIYINEVSRITGFSPTEILKNNKDTIKKLVMAISFFENGENYITDELFEKAYKLKQ